MFNSPEGKVLRCNSVAGNTQHEEGAGNNQSTRTSPRAGLLSSAYFVSLQSEAAKCVVVIFPRFALTHFHFAVLLTLRFFLSFFWRDDKLIVCAGL